MANRTYAESGLYDLAFSYRDYPLEVETLIQWFKIVNTTGAAPSNLLELACGPARHALEFAANGVSGVGLDISPEMCRYAKSLAVERGVALQIAQADMSEFELGETFDLILLMINSLCHLLEESSLRSHFQRIHQHLSPSGLYVVESIREEENADPGHSEWQMERGTDNVHVRWGWDSRFDYVHMKGNIGGHKAVLNDRFAMRRWRTSELISAAMSAGLSIVGHYGDFKNDYADEVAASVLLESSTTLHSCFVFGRD